VPVVSDIPPRVIAHRYLLLGLLGQGGMGRVWAARDELLNRDVAIKEVVPPPGLTATERHYLRERLMREARAIAQLDHRNAVRIFDVLYDGGEPWIVMELVASRSLEQVLELEGAMAPDRVARIGLALLSALRAAHNAGVLHRDVKPANVLLADDGRVVLTDFGLATAAGDSSMTSTGIVLGSPCYLAPERALDHPVGPAADLWSLGATLYVAVEGTAPYARSTPMATLTALVTEPPRPPRRAGALAPALRALLERDPARRADPDTARRLLRQAAAPVQAAPFDQVLLDRAPLSAPSVGSAPPDFETEGSPTVAVPARRRWPRRLITTAVVIVALAVAVAAGRLTITAASTGTDAGAPPPSWSPEELPSDPAVTGTDLAADNTAPSDGTLSGQPAGKSTVPKPAVGTEQATQATPATDATTQAAVGTLFINVRTNTCLDVPSGKETTADIQMWACFGAGNQQYAASDGTLRVLGKCVQVRGTSNGSHLRLATCSGSAAQRFEYNNALDLVSVQADKCVDVPDGNAANGIVAQIWDCTGAANQKWRHS